MRAYSPSRCGVRERVTKIGLDPVSRVDPDGRLRYVISERDPGVANWLELTGHPQGVMMLRWQRLSRELTAADGPRVDLVKHDELFDLVKRGVLKVEIGRSYPLKDAAQAHRDLEQGAFATQGSNSSSAGSHESVTRPPHATRLQRARGGRRHGHPSRSLLGFRLSNGFALAY